VKKASVLTDTMIDWRGGHLTINKGGRRGGGRGEAMMTDDGDRSDASPLSGVICIRR
jgi:hypothetical protein